jgi:3'-5' exoribonuclease
MHINKKTSHKIPEEFVKDLKGGSISSKFLISDKKVKLTKHGKEYLDITLSDKTGEIKGRMFSNGSLDSKIQNIENGNVYHIKGNLEDKYGRSVNITSINKCSEGEFEENDFIISLENDSQKLWDIINQTIKDIKNPDLKTILNLFFNDKKFKSEFCQSPAAIRIHHNYEGGLLEHTAHVVILCKTLCETYPKLDAELLYTGAILHDIGKIKIYEKEGLSIKYTDDGLLLEHIFISAQMVKERSNKKLISEKTLKKVLHLILSHHGDISNGWGSAVNPHLPEAVALHHADNMDAKVKGVLDN